MLGMIPHNVHEIKRHILETVTDTDILSLYLVFGGLWFVIDLYMQTIPLVFDQFGYSTALLGITFSAVAILQIILSPWIGVLADTHDRMHIGALACVGLTVLFALFAVSETVVAFALLMLAIAGFRLALNTTATAAVSERLPDGIEGIGWGLRDAFIYSGSAAGLVVGGIIVASTGDIRSVFLVLAPIMLAIGAVLAYRGGVSFTLSKPTIPPDMLSPSSVTGVIAEIMSVTSVIEEYKTISNTGVLSRFLAVQTLGTLGMGGTMFLLPVFAVDLGMDASNYLLLFGGASAIGIVMSLLGGIAANIVDKKYLYVANFAVEACMLFMFAITTNVVFFVFGLALFTAQTIFEPAVVAFFFDKFEDEEAGRAWSLDGMASKGVGSIAPAFGGALYVIEPRLVFALGGVVTGLAALIALTIPSEG